MCIRWMLVLEMFFSWTCLKGEAATGGVAKASESDGVFGAHCADMHSAKKARICVTCVV